MIAVMPGGSLVYFHKWAGFNLPPVVTFGDSVAPGSTEIPYQQATSFDFDNTYLNNVASFTQQYGPNNLFTLTAASLPSETAYFARAASGVTVTTMSNLDVYDDVNWFLAKYSQPSLRVSGLVVDAASNPQVAFPAVMTLLQGQVATVTRRPVGGAVISENVLTQKIAHAIGPSYWQTAYQLSPYSIEADVLQLDIPGFDVIGGNNLA
jgi:hypothetical protein